MILVTIAKPREWKVEARAHGLFLQIQRHSQQIRRNDHRFKSVILILRDIALHVSWLSCITRLLVVLRVYVECPLRYVVQTQFYSIETVLTLCVVRSTESERNGIRTISTKRINK